MKDSYDALKTEGRNPRTLNIDRMSTVDMVKTVNAEYRAVEDAVDLVAEDIAAAVDLISDARSAGHHLIYVGAGTSGRLGVVDASECPPTFGVDPSLVRGVIAGGRDAMFRSSEGTEDSPEEGEAAISAEGIEPGDVVVGLSASGRAPFVLGALKRAKELGARTVGVSCNPGSLIEEAADLHVSPYVGPEVISGSTRMKAGSAQKLILNIFSTCAMIKTGRVRSNLMINVRPSNEKLVERAVRIIIELAGCTREEAEEALREGGDVPSALVLIESRKK